MINRYLYLFFVFAYFSRLEADNIIFTSPLKTKALFNSADHVIATLEKYISTEEIRLETMKNTLDEWIEEHNSYKDDIESHLSNHISQFNYISKLKNRWENWLTETKNNTASDYISQMKNSNTTWASDEDMIGIMDSIINLQNIYYMTADSFAQGILKGVSTNTSLNYEECLMMAERCFETIHYKLALQWSLVAMEKYSKEGIDNAQQLSKLLYYISYTSYIAGNDDLALKSITSYMEKNPNDQKAKALQDVIHLRHPEKLEESMIKKWEISRHIEDLCKKLTTQEELSRINDLRCWYEKEETHFLEIAPLKGELLSFEPPLILFRDVLYDSEIDSLKKEAKDKFQEITTKESSSHHHDAVKVAYFENDANDNIRRISHRIEDMTGFPVSSKTAYRLHKYMPGGFYTEEEKFENSDERITSTIIFHMSNVIQGGSITFPRLNITVKAEKGDALVWYEKAPNHSEDLPRYSSCSVLAGYKWTLTSQVSI
ncbi:prolyl 4-hydroxylase subunit alpha-2-like isoform X1 [Planococcus citri]|uniref:prolyl 4-hydroxylase subunit alpha-2-like isoform X1 n=1 Tax=Planococcus citri TaxID=170843 RepID=UPI0031F8E7A0